MPKYFFFFPIKTFLRLEEKQAFLRIDKDIKPTKNRFGTISVSEVEKMRKVKNIIRKGRLSSVEKTRLTFESGEVMEIPDNTLIVDCSRNSTKFAQNKKVFDGDKINIQFILLPPIGDYYDNVFFFRK